jgi:hypothetical protein
MKKKQLHTRNQLSARELLTRHAVDALATAEIQEEEKTAEISVLFVECTTHLCKIIYVVIYMASL